MVAARRTELRRTAAVTNSEGERAGENERESGRRGEGENEEER